MEAAKQTAEMTQSRKASHPTDYKVHALHVDVRDEDGVQQMVNEAKSLFGRIDYFVNTAGVGSSVMAHFHAHGIRRCSLLLHGLLSYISRT